MSIPGAPPVHLLMLMADQNDRLILKLDDLVRHYEDLTAQMNDPAIGKDVARMTSVGKEQSRLNRIVQTYREYRRLCDQALQAQSLLDEAGQDPEIREMAHVDFDESNVKAAQAMDDLKSRLVMSDDDAIDSIMMEIRAGTGGDEAALFARDLLEMYSHYADRRSWKMEVLSASPTELGGLREVVINFHGEGVYRELAYEGGGHRVQRVPETETQGRIHTSAATVAVLPEREEITIDINWEKDVIEHTSRAGGPGGQNVNKVESAIRLEHPATGITVSMRDDKSQHKNRAKARRIMAARVQDYYLQQQLSKEAAARKSMIGSGDRSQRIRTYNFPQNRCTDHRIGYSGNLQQIMAGHLDDLIEALISHETATRLSSL